MLFKQPPGKFGDFDKLFCHLQLAPMQLARWRVYSKAASADGSELRFRTAYMLTLGIQIAQRGQYLHTLGLKLGSIYILGFLGLNHQIPRAPST